MNNLSIFNFSDYKVYLAQLEKHKAIKGFRTRLAEATGCQNAFVSQVLNGDVNFNLEQGLKISSFLSLSDEELQYFLWMIEHKRAGTEDLKKYFLKLMKSLKEKNLDIKSRVNVPEVLSKEAQAMYCSSWIYSAVHIAVMIKELNSVEKLAKALSISLPQVKKAVSFLVQNGFVQDTAKGLISGNVQIHLSRESENISKYHTNWRIEAIKSLDQDESKDLHYSGVSSLSFEDVDKIRSMFVDLIEKYVRTIEKSPEETLYTFNLDFFKVARQK